MAETFDPYLKWLGIAPKDQPPNHYRLLGIDLFMDDPDVIENAADQRMAHVRSFQSGNRAGLSQQLLNEIATAKVCLLNPQQKEAYDRTLKNQTSSAKPIPKAKPLSTRGSNVADAVSRPTNIANPFDALANASPPVHGVARRKRRKPAWQDPLVLGIGGVLTLLVFVGLVYVLLSGSDENRVARAPQRPPQENSSVQPGPPHPADQPNTHPDAVLASPDATMTPNEPVQPPEVEPDDEVVTSPPIDNADKEPIVEPPQNQPDSQGPTSSEVAMPESNGTDESAQKHAVPDAEAVKRQQQLIADLFKDDIAAATTDDAKLALAETWMQHATETTDDDAARYVLLRLAAQSAVNAGDAKTALAAVDQLASYFEIDAWGFRISALAAIAKARGEDFRERNQQVAELATELIDRAVADANFKSVEELVEIALASARNANNIPLVKELVVRKKEIDELVKAGNEAMAALAALEKDPSDPNANLVASRYLCFVKSEWSKGLPLLAKSNEADLKDAAEMELASPSDAEAQVKLADTWWHLAETGDEVSKGPMRERAVFWYRKALPEISSGLLKNVVEERLAEFETMSANKELVENTTKPIDLLTLINGTRDSVEGDWRVEDGDLITPAVKCGRLEIPYVPPPEYTLKKTATLINGGDGLSVGLVYGGRQVRAVLGGWGGETSGLDQIDGQRAPDNESAHRGQVFFTGKPVTITATVRATGIHIVCDDQIIIEWKGDPQRVSMHRDWRLRKNDCLFLAVSRNTLRIHSIELTPIKTLQSKPTRGRIH